MTKKSMSKIGIGLVLLWILGCGALLKNSMYKEVLQILEVVGTFGNIDFETISNNQAQFETLGQKYGVEIWLPTKALLIDLQQFNADKTAAAEAYKLLAEAMRNARARGVLSPDEQHVLDALEKYVKTEPITTEDLLCLQP